MPPHPDTPPRAGQLIRMATIVYALMAALGVGIGQGWHGTLFPSLAWPADARAWRETLILPACGAGVLVILNVFLLDWSPSYRRLRSAMAALVGGLSRGGAAYLAVLSSVGEELLFRGAMQPYFGLTLTSLLFGVLHQGPGGPFSVWTLWATAAGFLLGAMAQTTGSLWPPLLCHAAVNLYGLLTLRHESPDGKDEPPPGSPRPGDEESRDAEPPAHDAPETHARPSRPPDHED